MDARPEFRGLQFLIVGSKAHAAQTLRMAISIAGMKHATATADSAAALELLRTQDFSAVFCDEHAKPIGELPFYIAARRAFGIRNPMIPIFLVCSHPKRKFIEAVRDRGVSDVIARPVSAATILRKLRAAIEQPRTFIRVGDFFGPDRRAPGRPEFRGPERRDDSEMVLL